MVSVLGRVRPQSAEFESGELLTVMGWYMRRGLLPFARGLMFRLRVGRCSGPILIGRGVRVLYARRLSVGRWVYIGSGCEINAFSVRGVSFEDRVTVREHAWIQCSSSPTHPGVGLRIGEGSYVGPRATIGVAGPIKIGRGCQIGANLTLIAENHKVSGMGVVSSTETSRVGISIGDGCWLGHGVTILDGVSLGANCVVGAGAVVTKSFPAGSRLLGVPARVC